DEDRIGAWAAEIGPGVVVVDSLEAHPAAVRDALARRGGAAGAGRGGASRDALAGRAVRVVLVPVAWADGDRLVAVAGEPVAWGGTPTRPARDLARPRPRET